MDLDPSQLLQHTESEQFEKKSRLDPSSQEDILQLVKIIVSMANTKGGTIFIGTAGEPIPQGHHKLFDSAVLDDKVNKYVEPRIGEIKSLRLGVDFYLLEIGKGPNQPYVFKRDGGYRNCKGEELHAFHAGEILVRHSSKTELSRRSDIDAMMEDYRRRLFENVRMVFEAGPAAHVCIEPTAKLSVRVDPAAVGAQPVYEVLTSEPFRDFDQELLAAVKSWKTSRQLLNEKQIFKAYAQRTTFSF